MFVHQQPHGLRHSSAASVAGITVSDLAEGHGLSSLVFVVCCVGSNLCVELRIRSEESGRACVSVVYEPEKRGGLGPSWPDDDREKKFLLVACIFNLLNHVACLSNPTLESHTKTVEEI